MASLCLPTGVSPRKKLRADRGTETILFEKDKGIASLQEHGETVDFVEAKTSEIYLGEMTLADLCQEVRAESDQSKLAGNILTLPKLPVILPDQK